jgi:membrane-associated phospholipid phosphatase
LSRFKQADINILKWIYQRPFKRTWFIKALIFIGDGPSWMLVIFFSALFSQLTDTPILGMMANLLIIGFIIGNATFVPMKEKIHRRRPYANRELQEELGIEIINRDPGHGSKELESFPSGHALWTMMCVIIICFQFGWPAFILLGWLAPIMILLRPYLGVHYPSDVLFGAALGAVFAGIAIGSAPFVTEFLSYLQQQSGAFYYLGYWAFIALFMYKGMKSWLRRV